MQDPSAEAEVDVTRMDGGTGEGVVDPDQVDSVEVGSGEADEAETDLNEAGLAGAEPAAARPAAVVPKDRFYVPPGRSGAGGEGSTAAKAKRPAKKPEEREFILGYDVTAPEVLERRRQRAKKYGTELVDPLLEIEGVSDRAEFERRQQRLQRFGMVETAERIIETSVSQYDALNGDEVLPPDQYRYDAVYIYGITADMSTKTIMQYFDLYSPTRVEWLSDSAANVVFADTHSCKRALSRLSRPIDGDMKRVAEEHRDRPDLPFILMRKGKKTNQEGATLMMRVCKKTDVKQPYNKRKPSQWARKHYAGRRGRKQRWGKKKAKRGPRGATAISKKSISIRKKGKEVKKALGDLQDLKIEIQQNAVGAAAGGEGDATAASRMVAAGSEQTTNVGRTAMDSEAS